MAATLPVASAKRQAASAFGPMEPAGKLNSRITFGLPLRKAFAVGFPKSRNTASASVAMMNVGFELSG